MKLKKKKKSPAASALSVKLGYVFGGVLCFLLLFQMVQFYDLRDKLDFIDGLQESQSTVIEQLGLSQEYLTQFATDLNQIRGFLLLPETDYDFSNLGESNIEVEEEDITSQIFELVDALADAEEKEALYSSRKEEIYNFINENPLSSDTMTVSMTVEETVNGTEWQFLKTETQQELLYIVLAYDGSLEFDGYHYDLSWSATEDLSVFKEEFQIYPNEFGTIQILIDRQIEVLSFYDNTFFEGEEMQSFILEYDLKLSSRTETELGFEYLMRNSDGTVIAQFAAEQVLGTPSVYVSGERLEFGADLSESTRVIEFILENTDPRTDLQIKLEDRTKELAQLMQDRAFISTLEALGLSMSEVVEEETRLYYSILNAEGEVLRNLILDFSTGEVTVELSDTGASEDLATAILNLQDTGKKKLSTYLT